MDNGLTIQNKAADAKATGDAIDAINGAIGNEASTRQSADANLQTQIDQLIAPSGEAPSAAEIENARIGAPPENTVYPTLGDAIRGQVTDLKSATSQTVINIENDGTDTLFWRTSWKNADTWNDGTIDSNIKYRVSSLANISFDKEIVLNISSSFYVKLFYMRGSSVSSRSDWINGKKRIKANQAFRICIKRTSENSSEKANIHEFVSCCMTFQ